MYCNRPVTEKYKVTYMKRYLLFFALFCWMNCVSSQNYRSFLHNNISYYENDKEAVSIRADSFKIIGNDTVYYFYRQFIERSNNCIDPYGESWFGRCLIVKPGGINIYIRPDGDSIIFNTLAETGESWICYRYPNGSYVKATVILMDMVQVLGQVDSFKRITFAKYNSLNMIVPDSVNNKYFDLSKDHGFISVFGFRTFPEFGIDNADYYDCSITRNLVGMTRGNLGIRNIKALDIFDFEPGDEYHTFYHWHESFNYLPNMKSDTIKTIKKVLYKFYSGDTVLYVIKVEKLQFSNKLVNQVLVRTIERVHDTMIEKYYPGTILDSEPGEIVYGGPAVIGQGWFFYYLYPYYIKGLNSKVYGAQDPPYHYVGTPPCLHFIIVDGCIPIYNYVKGLGGPYYYCFGIKGDEKENKIVYFKKGAEEWGTKLDMTASLPYDINTGFKLYPNPANGWINIGIPDIGGNILNAELFDLNGKRILIVKNLHLGINQLDISSIGKGFYILNLFDEKGSYGYKKITVDK